MRTDTGQRSTTNKQAQDKDFYANEATAIIITASAITAVASQPSIRSRDVTINFPIISGFAAIDIIIAMMGTAITPLMDESGQLSLNHAASQCSVSSGSDAKGR